MKFDDFFKQFGNLSFDLEGDNEKHFFTPEELFQAIYGRLKHEEGIRNKAMIEKMFGKGGAKFKGHDWIDDEVDGITREVCSHCGVDREEYDKQMRMRH